MAGHSKWANIQHRKNVQDNKRSKLFTKLIREVTVAARMGGDDIRTNPRLRLAVEKSLQANVTKEAIDRAVKRGAGGLEGADLEEVVYEGYGPGGVAIMVECLTDNHVRTVNDVRHLFTKHDGSLGTSGSVAYLFSRKGVIVFPPGDNEEQIMEAVMEANAEDFTVNEDGSIDVLTLPENFMAVKNLLEERNLMPLYSEINLVPSIYVSLEPEIAVKLTKLISCLEELDDVQNVYSNRGDREVT